MDYIIGMAISMIPERVWLCNAPDSNVRCPPCVGLPYCDVVVPIKVRMKLGKMALFIAAQYATINFIAEPATSKGFKVARYQARQMAFSNSGIDDLKKFDKAAADAAGIEFTTSDADLTDLALNAAQYQQYFLYRDEWMARYPSGYEAWQKADSRLGIWLDLWDERNKDDTEDPGEGDDNDFNRFGSIEYRWEYPNRPGINILGLNIQGDDFNGTVTSPSWVYGSVMGIEYRCFPPAPPNPCPGFNTTQIHKSLKLFGPEMFIIGLNDFSFGSNPRLTVAVSRQEPEGQDVIVWKAKYPEVVSSATSEVFGGSVAMWGNDDYDTRIIETK